MTESGWTADVLGEGFEAMTFDLGPDDAPLPNVDRPASGVLGAENGESAVHLAATLVRALPARRTFWQRLVRRTREFENVDVLYVHGWSDYFFQRDLAHFWTDRGASFYALDLRRYGRSFRDGQAPGYISNLDEYDEELGLAIDTIRQEIHPRKQATGRRLVLLGHSTGGLVLSLWASRNPGTADALILNSPWLEFQLTARGRQIIGPLVKLGARFSPLETAPLFDYGYYARAQHEVGPKHELENLDPVWRPEQVRHIQSGWLSAILEGHQRVHNGLGIEVPICVMLSARTALPVRWSEELTRADTVLDVQEVAKAALGLGSSVTIEWIEGALHDVFLSSEVPRATAYRRLDRWVRAWSAAVASPSR